MRSFVLFRRPSPAMLVALLALFAALAGGDAYAAATNFLLNTSNTTSAQTALSGSAVAGKAALKVTNTNTATGSTPLSLTTANGHAPLTVSAGAGKVPGLDSDLLDGNDSSAFTLGRGRNSWAGADVAAGTSAVFAGDPGPHAYSLTLACSADTTKGGSWIVRNTSSTSTFFLSATEENNPTLTNFQAPPGDIVPAAGGFDTTSHQTTIQLFWPGSKLVTIIAFYGRGAPCHGQAEVLTAGS